MVSGAVPPTSSAARRRPPQRQVTMTRIARLALRDRLMQAPNGPREESSQRVG